MAVERPVFWGQYLMPLCKWCHRSPELGILSSWRGCAWQREWRKLYCGKGKSKVWLWLLSEGCWYVWWKTEMNPARCLGISRNWHDPEPSHGSADLGGAGGNIFPIEGDEFGLIGFKAEIEQKDCSTEVGLSWRVDAAEWREGPTEYRMVPSAYKWICQQLWLHH